MPGLGMVVWALVLLGFIVGLAQHLVRGPYKRAKAHVASLAGWVYFIASNQEDAPIKIGLTQRDPLKERMPELETMSPFPLHVIHIIRTKNCYQLEREIHDELKQYREHGEWFDRDAVMMYIDHLKGAV